MAVRIRSYQRSLHPLLLAVYWLVKLPYLSHKASWSADDITRIIARGEAEREIYSLQETKPIKHISLIALYEQIV